MSAVRPIFGISIEPTCTRGSVVPSSAGGGSGIGSATDVVDGSAMVVDVVDDVVLVDGELVDEVDVVVVVGAVVVERPTVVVGAAVAGVRASSSPLHAPRTSTPTRRIAAPRRIGTVCQRVIAATARPAGRRPPSPCAGLGRCTPGCRGRRGGRGSSGGRLAVPRPVGGATAGGGVGTAGTLVATARRA